MKKRFAPHFTFHGFRYVEVTGYPGTPTLDAIKGDVVSSVSGDPVAKLTTSSDLVNQMWSIGIWGQRGNFLSIPTDCPQRDERLGWMGDAGVFWRTGSYNFDIAAFSQKFMQDIVDAQTPTGCIYQCLSQHASFEVNEPKVPISTRHDRRAGMGRCRRDRSVDNLDAVRQQGRSSNRTGTRCSAGWSSSRAAIRISCARTASVPTSPTGWRPTKTRTKICSRPPTGR